MKITKLCSCPGSATSTKHKVRSFKPIPTRNLPVDRLFSETCWSHTIDTKYLPIANRPRYTACHHPKVDSCTPHHRRPDWLAVWSKCTERPNLRACSRDSRYSPQTRSGSLSPRKSCLPSKRPQTVCTFDVLMISEEVEQHRWVCKRKRLNKFMCVYLHTNALDEFAAEELKTPTFGVACHANFG